MSAYIVYVCDLCGHEEPSEKAPENWVNLDVPFPEDNISRLVLCKPCVTMFRNWWIEQKENATKSDA